METTVLSGPERAQMAAVLCELDPTRRGLPAELRKAHRRPLARRILVYRLPPTEKGKLARSDALTRDLSAGGLGLSADEAFAPGDRFVWPVRFEEGGGRLMLCEVVCARRSPNHRWSVGARFVATADDPSGTASIPPEWRRVAGSAVQ